jgi:hypothetical protein
LVQADQGEVTCEGLGPDGCPEGKIPSLSLENQEIWSLFLLMFSGLVRQDGFDYGAIQVVFDTCEIKKERRPKMLRQITLLIDVVNKEREKRSNHG